MIPDAGKDSAAPDSAGSAEHAGHESDRNRSRRVPVRIRRRRRAAAGMLAALALVTSAAAGTTAHAASPVASLFVFRDGWSTFPGQSITTVDNGATDTLIMQDDGNLVEYINGTPIWATATQGHSGSHSSFQGGVLSVIDPSGAVLWHSDVNVGPGGMIGMTSQLKMFDASHTMRWYTSSGVNLSELVLYSGTAIAAGTHQLVMQTDGNLVYYNAAYQPVWATGTARKGSSAAAELNDDCTITVTDFATGAVWRDPGRTGTACRVSLQNDGNIVISDGSGSILWASGTFG